MSRVLALVIISFIGLYAQADDRVALLIGNQEYERDLALERPHEDVEAIRLALISSGWSDERIKVLKDANLSEIDSAIVEFTEQLARIGAESTGFFYYSGHGGSIQQGARNRNFIIPVGEKIQFAGDLRTKGYRLSDLFELLEDIETKGVFVIVDACRDVLPTRDVRGSGMKGMISHSPSNVYLAYATSDGAFAPDDGFYADTLAREIIRPGQNANEAFFNVATEVQAKRGSQMRPVLSPASVGSMCFNGCKSPSGTFDSLTPEERKRMWRAAINYYNNEYFDSALVLFKGLCDHADPRACHMASTIHFLEIVESADLNIAIEFAQRACSLGEIESCFNFGLAAITADQPELAMSGFADACDGGIVEACVRLVPLLTVLSPESAMRVEERACYLGHQPSC